MRKFLLYSSALVAFTMSGVAEAACIQTPNCTTLGYTSTTACEGGIKCPFGNAWNCTLADEISQLKITIEKLEQTVQDEALSKCQIGDILYSDMSCNANVVASKTPIGVIFDTTNRLAIGLESSAEYWSDKYFDVPELSNITSSVTADWQGKKNTQIVSEYCKAKGYSCPAFEYVNSYQTEGTKAGDWYLPAAGELKAIYDSQNSLDTALSKIGGEALNSMSHWSSSEYSDAYAWMLYFYDADMDNNDKDKGYSVRPVLAF